MDSNISDFFKRAIQFNKLAHAYLFYGPSGSGKKDTAFWLADYLKVSLFDILYIVPGEDKKDISIDQIRKAKKYLSLSSQNYRFVIIDNAELMNIASSNALLKTLLNNFGNSSNDAFQYASIVLSQAVNEGDLIGWEFVNVNGSNNINAVDVLVTTLTVG